MKKSIVTATVDKGGNMKKSIVTATVDKALKTPVERGRKSGSKSQPKASAKIKANPAEATPAKSLRGRPKKEKTVTFNVSSDYIEDVEGLKANIDMLVQSFNVLLDIQDFLEKNVASTSEKRRPGRPKKEKTVSFSVYSDYIEDDAALKGNIDLLVQNISNLLNIQDYLEKKIRKK